MLALQEPRAEMMGFAVDSEKRGVDGEDGGRKITEVDVSRVVRRSNWSAVITDE